MSLGEYLETHKSALRWDIKRAMKSLCEKLAEIGEECFIVSANPVNGMVGHMGSIRGDEYINEKSNILYDFLEYCRECDESVREGKMEESEEEEEKVTSTDPDLDPPIMLTDPRTDPDDGTHVSDVNPKAKVLSNFLKKQGKRKRSTYVIAPVTPRTTPGLVTKFRWPEKNASLRNRPVTVEDVKTRFKRYVFSRNSQFAKKQTVYVNDKFFCDVCSMSFKFQALYDAHQMSEEHIQTSKTYCRCYKCGEQFGGRKDVYKHILKCY